MENGWLISYLLLWIITLLLVVVVLVHSRMLGLLHYRFGPGNAKPLADGPEIGEKLKQLDGILPDNQKWKLEFPYSKDVVILFVSPQCNTCNEVLPHLQDFFNKHNSIETLLVSIIDDLGMNRAYIAYRGLDKMKYIISEKMGDDLEIEGVPYSLYINRQGIVCAKGLVNNYENLIGLVKSAERFEAFDE